MALDLLNKINAVKVKMGKLITTYAEGAEGVEIVVAERTGNIDFEAYQTFNLGFTPQAVMIFTETSVNFGSGDDDDIDYFLGFGRHDWYKDSSDSEKRECLGGIAIGGVGATYTAYNAEVFRIVENGVRTHCYNTDNEKSSGRRRLSIGSKAQTLYYIAVG